MYQIVKKGTEKDLFSEEVELRFYSAIQQEITAMLIKEDNPKPAILGAFVLHDVPLRNGKKTNVWIEYNAHILPMGLIDAGVHNCIIYDKIPDIVLDKYNEIKTFVFGEGKNENKN